MADRKKVSIAVDIGSSTGRLFAGWISEDRLCMEEIYRFVTEDVYVVRERVRNIYRYYDEILNGIRQYIEKENVQIISIGVDTFGSDFGLLDKKGNLLMLPISYRGLAIEREFFAESNQQMNAWKIYSHGGNQCMVNDTLNQLRRMKAKNDIRLEQAEGMLFVGDLFHYLLCGNRGAERSMSSYSRLWNAKKDDWDNETFLAFGLPLSLKSKIVSCGDILGKVNLETAVDMGLHYCPEVIAPSTHDTACAAFAVPDSDDDWMFISSGSWSLIGLETEKPIISKEAWKFNASNSYMPIHSNMFKKIMTGMWILQMCRKQWNIAYNEIVRLASEEPENSVYIDADSIDFYSPVNMPEAICNNIRKKYGIVVRPDEYGRIARIIFESLALKYRMIARKLIAISEKKVNKVYIVGGASKNELLNQYAANAMNMPIFTGITEASSVGNLLCQMYGKKILKNRKEVKDLLKRTFTMKTYYPKNPNIWDRKYRDFIKYAREPFNVCSAGEDEEL